MTLLSIFPIENLEKINVRYRLFKIRGLLTSSDDYDKNVQLLSDKLSRLTKSPCAAVKKNADLFISQPIGCKDPPVRLPLVGAEVIIEKTDIERTLAYGNLNDEDMYLAIRFLQFYLNGHLHEISTLWSPGPGMPYFQKESFPDFKSQEAVMYRGFRIRLMRLPNNRIGVCVDITRKYASRNYISSSISSNQIHKLKFKRCIYEFGNRWYEISIDNVSGLNVSDEKIEGISLHDYIHLKCRGLKPAALISLPKDSAVLTYKTGLGQTKRVASALCRLTYSTKHPAVAEYHKKTILYPSNRRREIDFVVQTYLADWGFNGTRLALSGNMLEVKCERLDPPELQFGHKKVLGIHQRDGIIAVTLDDLPKKKHELLYSSDGGFYVQRSLDRQYIILPKSIKETFGMKYVNDIKAQFVKSYSPNRSVEYDPVVITYDNSVGQSVYSLGTEILRATNEALDPFHHSGFGIVIIPRLAPRRSNREDELANLIFREFRKLGIHVSISHTEIPTASYVLQPSTNGPDRWELTTDPRKAKRFRGYLQNIVLNKILLLNRCWPFVLNNPLNADLIISIDVKNNFAGFTIVHKDGRTFAFTTSDSDQREQLSRPHLAKKLTGYLRDELDGETQSISKITILRDGQLYPNEQKGINEAFNQLASEGLIAKSYECNQVEIKKSSRAPVRMFETLTPTGSMKQWTLNPIVGTYCIFGDTAFLCNTGRPYEHPGTTNPLQVVKVEGQMPFEKILEDIFALANLTWTKPDDCSRFPITTRMTDIRLREEAGFFESDSLRFGEED